MLLKNIIPIKALIAALCMTTISSGIINAQSFSVGGINYSIISSSNKTVTVASNKSATGDIVIPKTVNYNSEEYSVTEISREAFKNASITSVSMPEGLQSIGWDAFLDCHNLTQIVVPNSVTHVDNGSFARCNNLKALQYGASVASIGRDIFTGLTSLKKVISLNPTPPSVDSWGTTTTSATLYVPESAIDSYKNAPIWRNFSSIVAYHELVIEIPSTPADDELGTPVTKLEVGKSYVFKSARYSDYNVAYYYCQYRYISDNGVGSHLKCSVDLDENCIWVVEQGSTENSLYLKNAVTGGYLFTTSENDYIATSTSPTDIYVFNGSEYFEGDLHVNFDDDYYEGTIGLSTSDDTTAKTFVNAAGNNAPFIYSWTFDRGSQWYAYEVSTQETLEKIEFAEDNVVCPLGSSVNLKVNKIPFNAMGEISFSSNNPDIAIVDSYGVVTGIAEGETEIIATCGSFTATCRVTVKGNNPDTPIDYNGTPVTKLEVGKSYVFKSARYSDYNVAYYYCQYRYISDNGVGSHLKCSVDLDENCIWVVEQGSTENSLYLKNAVTGGYLFTTSENDYIATSTSPTDIYVFNGSEYYEGDLHVNFDDDYYEGTIGLSTSDDTTAKTFVNAAGNNAPFIYSWTFDRGSQWYAYEVSASDPEPLERIEFAEDKVVCPLGGSVNLKVNKIPFNAMGEISFSSNNPDIAIVDSYGVVTGMTEGETEIIATCGSFTATCQVTVERNDPDTPIDYNETPVTQLEVGKSYIFKNARTMDPDAGSYYSDSPYLCNYKIDNQLILTDTFDNMCVWTVEQSSTTGAIYIKNAQTGGYLYTKYWDYETYLATSTYPIDIYVLDGKYYDGTIGLSTSDNPSGHTFLNKYAYSNNLCSYTFDKGSEWYAYEVSTSDPEPLERIEFAEDYVVCPLGGSVNLKVNKIPFNAIGEISFSSNNPDIAIVDSYGVVTGISEGETEIIATCGSFTASCWVIVERQDTKAWIQFEAIIGNVGETIAIGARVFPEDAADTTINWSSSNPEVVAVDAEGIVWFNAAGSATITAECQGTDFSIPFVAKEVLANALNVFPVEAVGNVGHEFSLLALHEPENTTDTSVTWESSDPAVATVSEDGHVSLAAIGSAQITARSGEHTAVCDITVNDNTVSLTEMAVTGVIINIVDGGIVVRNAPMGESIAVYTVDGKVANGAIVDSDETRLNLAAGIYIVKVSPSTVAKVLVK